MKKFKFFISVALLGTISYGAFSVYEGVTMSADEKALHENIEALTLGEGDLPNECYDKYKAYAGGALQRFRPCDTDGCTHIWAYSPSKRTMCQK